MGGGVGERGEEGRRTGSGGGAWLMFSAVRCDVCNTLGRVVARHRYVASCTYSSVEDVHKAHQTGNSIIPNLYLHSRD